MFSNWIQVNWINEWFLINHLLNCRKQLRFCTFQCFGIFSKFLEGFHGKIKIWTYQPNIWEVPVKLWESNELIWYFIKNRFDDTESVQKSQNWQSWYLNLFGSFLDLYVTWIDMWTYVDDVCYAYRHKN